MSGDVFQNREGVRRALNLPGLVQHSIIGPSDEAFQGTLKAMIEDVVGADQIVNSTVVASRNGKFISYRFEVYHTNLEDVEEIYRRAAKIEGVQFVL